MKRALIASAFGLCAFFVWAGVGSAQFDPNSPAQPPGNLAPSQPGLLVPQPGNTNIGIPSQNIPAARAPESADSGAKKKEPPGAKAAAKPSDGKKTSGAAARASKGVGTQIEVNKNAPGTGFGVPTARSGSGDSQPDTSGLSERPEVSRGTQGSAGGGAPETAKKAGAVRRPGVGSASAPGGTIVTPPPDPREQIVPRTLGGETPDPKTVPGTPMRAPTIAVQPRNVPLQQPSESPAGGVAGNSPGTGAPSGTKTASPGGTGGRALPTDGQLPISKGLEEHLKTSGGNPELWRLWEQLRELVENGPLRIDPLRAGRGDRSDPSGMLERLAAARPDDANRRSGEGRGLDAARARSDPFTDPSGQASSGFHAVYQNRQGEGGSRESYYKNDSTGETITVRESRSSSGSSMSIRYATNDGERGAIVNRNREGDEGSGSTYTRGTTVSEDAEGRTTIETSAGPVTFNSDGTLHSQYVASEPKEDDEGGNSPEKLVDESMAPRFHGYYCHPIKGCARVSVTNPITLRMLPRDRDGAEPVQPGSRTGPSAATDPNPDDIGVGGGAGGSASRPDPCRYAQGPSCGDTEPGGTGGPPTR